MTAVDRGGHADVSPGVDVVAGDASNPEFTTEVVRGAAVVYQCLNPPYTKWPELFPPLQAAVLKGAASAGAKLVSFENLYSMARLAAHPSLGICRSQPPALRGG